MPRTHKTLPRLYVEPPLADGAEIALDKDQTNHLVNVLRRTPGDNCVVFNGRDGAFLAEIVQVAKKLVSLRLIERTTEQTPANDLWFGFAPIKRLDYEIQKATEMGAGMIQPVITRHVQNARINPDKLKAHAIEAAQQCEVLSVPDIAPETSFEKLVTGWTDSHGDRILVFCDEAAASASPVETLTRLKGKRLGLLIGPEGGFSEEERERLLGLDFVVPISLGPRILRADTATVAALALIQAVVGDW
ncbi:16S rRNA (uracil(1498)-N(3))-methyltransferase [Pelagibacterium halotolerans]|uniref:Ribosomal RNA small subunit methyltransferase E n=1 Tax=Pelagibacterium halotolerans (strain DSM 22347 / JCM 15775 / CGMCC 1.7692 / B2) TaxID=1082931 RepID=G4RB18_PELHB|nr:16S rRNA (uracil(1498)-N(3))-methyltransferase [Pelagibacterium halotolerans]AEQ50527.1 ribosomal RNA small subunit methyltransferase E [Pelagibacterium halotolerans B2]QJR19522.1 16S rRNA (uracil(1498)-N(3))-methyltransferase [Pelagibacterium halotolerans]SDZ89034.1 16S rRNA (uracil1498-N3)-methyltransferase [Pelagibacterium halotolerans]